MVHVWHGIRSKTFCQVYKPATSNSISSVTLLVNAASRRSWLASSSVPSSVGIPLIDRRRSPTCSRPHLRENQDALVIGKAMLPCLTGCREKSGKSKTKTLQPSFYFTSAAKCVIVSPLSTTSSKVFVLKWFLFFSFLWCSQDVKKKKKLLQNCRKTKKQHINNTFPLWFVIHMYMHCAKKVLVVLTNNQCESEWGFLAFKTKLINSGLTLNGFKVLWTVGLNMK